MTPPANAPIWPNVSAHAIDRVPGRPLILVGDEVYGTYAQGIAPFFVKEQQGCPWGWVHLIDIADVTRPTVVGEFKIAENTEAFCQQAEGQDPRSTFSAHNMLALRDTAFLTWYAGGVRAFSLTNPTNPAETAIFLPTPLASVATEDPATTAGMHKIAMWSSRSSRTACSTSSMFETASTSFAIAGRTLPRLIGRSSGRRTRTSGSAAPSQPRGRGASFRAAGRT